MEFADRARPVPEKLDVGFLFYGQDMIVKYKATRINTSVTHTQRQLEVASSSSRRINH